MTKLNSQQKFAPVDANFYGYLSFIRSVFCKTIKHKNSQLCTSDKEVLPAIIPYN